jgi:hypothetical protein
VGIADRRGVALKERQRLVVAFVREVVETQGPLGSGVVGLAVALQGAFSDGLGVGFAAGEVMAELQPRRAFSGIHGQALARVALGERIIRADGGAVLIRARKRLRRVIAVFHRGRAVRHGRGFTQHLGGLCVA